MDWLDQSEFFAWLLQYGSAALFLLLALGIIALPIPDETLLVVSGFFIAKGYLFFFPTLIAAYLGSMFGISISYLIGAWGGHYLLEKYGRWFGLHYHHLEKTYDWFKKYGKWVLCFGYFIPGIRHLTGIAAGTLELPYKSFALFAYTGAVLWASSFLTIGYLCGEHCLRFLHHIEDHALPILTPIIIIIILIIYYRYFTKKRSSFSHTQK